jgi:hypothetical protein
MSACRLRPSRCRVSIPRLHRTRTRRPEDALKLLDDGLPTVLRSADATEAAVFHLRELARCWRAGAWMMRGRGSRRRTSPSEKEQLATKVATTSFSARYSRGSVSRRMRSRCMRSPSIGWTHIAVRTWFVPKESGSATGTARQAEDALDALRRALDVQTPTISR